MITIDGSYGEGGGQIIRTALALSTLLKVPFKAVNIRKGRGKPGLKQQHIACINALKSLCNAKADGDEAGSTELLFAPGEIKSRSLSIDIGTAGSTTLLLQSLLLPCILAPHPVKLEIKGGTSGKWQMPFDYFTHVMLPHLAKYADIRHSMKRRGYYPEGGGCIELKIAPKFSMESRSSAPMIMLKERNGSMVVKGISHASLMLQEARVAERQADAAKFLISSAGCRPDIAVEYSNTSCPGSGITLWAFFSDSETNDINPVIIGADIEGEKGKPAEDVGTEAAKLLISELNSGAPVDSHLADSLVPFLAVFGGSIKTSEITAHTRANIYASEMFLGKRFEIDEKEKIISAAKPA